MTEQHPSPEQEGPYSAQAAAFVERLAADLAEAGTQRMAARVFACLMVSEEPALTAADLAERLGVSPAAISGAVRYLSLTNLIIRERQPGSRRERYRLHQHVWYEAMTGRDGVLRRLLNTLRSGLDVVDPGGAAHRRITESVEFMSFLDEEIAAMLRRWQERQARRAREEANRPGAAEERRDGGNTGGGDTGGGGTGGDVSAAGTSAGTPGAAAPAAGSPASSAPPASPGEAAGRAS